jgi:hypothetical protein
MQAHHLKPIKASGTDWKETRDISVRTWWPTNIGQIACVIVVCTSVTARASVSFPSEQQLTENCQHQNIGNTRHCHQTRTSSSYRRSAFGYRSYTTSADVGFYTQQTCETHIDHVVSLKDAHESGASGWSSQDKITFANDRENHVASCAHVNSSKGASKPSEFLRKSSDGQGLDFEIRNFCGYLSVYKTIKVKYGLSFSNNSPMLFKICDSAQ